MHSMFKVSSLNPSTAWPSKHCQTQALRLQANTTAGPSILERTLAVPNALLQVVPMKRKTITCIVSN